MKKKELKKIIIKAVNSLELKKCVCCGKLIDKKEFEAGEGACFRCWEK